MERIESPTSEPTIQPKGFADITHTLNVRNVPYAAWKRAKQNAIASNLAFRDYVIQLLNRSEPLDFPSH